MHTSTYLYKFIYMCATSYLYEYLYKQFGAVRKDVLFGFADLIFFLYANAHHAASFRRPAGFAHALWPDRR